MTGHVELDQVASALLKCLDMSHETSKDVSKKDLLTVSLRVEHPLASLASLLTAKHRRNKRVDIEALIRVRHTSNSLFLGCIQSFKRQLPSVDTDTSQYVRCEMQVRVCDGLGGEKMSIVSRRREGDFKDLPGKGIAFVDGTCL